MPEAKVSWFQRTFGFSRKSRDTVDGRRAGTLPGRHRDHHWASAIAIEDGNWNQVDIEQMAQKLKIDENAQQDGLRNIPATDAKAPGTTGTQATIIAEINGVIHQSHGSCQHRLTELNNGVTQAMNRLRAAVQRISTSARRHALAIQQRKDAAKPRIQDADRRLVNKEKELRDIKQKHGIQREPVDSQAWPLKLGIVLAIIFTEGFVNTYFFARGSEAGLLGGVLQAMMFAVIDGGIVTGLGILAAPIRNKVFDHPLTKPAAAVALLIFLVWMILYNLGVTHYREAFSALHPDPMAEAMHRLTEQKLALRKFDSYILFFFGAVLTAFGFITGFLWRDPIPGYEKAHQDYEEAREEFRGLYENLQNGILQAADEIIERVRQEIREATEQHESIVYLAGRNQLLQVNFGPYVKDMVETANALIRRYQTKNAAVRTTPPPEYFGTSVYQSSKRITNPPALQQNPIGNSQEMVDQAVRQQEDTEAAILSDAETETAETRTWARNILQSEGSQQLCENT
ncbi:MAG: hypothetical protein OXU92_05880 [Deltaproteobacteria bacterium]|nr:hypothetical protein [Deltaproteobacteria bacterium]